MGGGLWGYSPSLPNWDTLGETRQRFVLPATCLQPSPLCLLPPCSSTRIQPGPSPAPSGFSTTPSTSKVMPAESRDNTSYYFFTQQGLCLPNSSFTEQSQLLPCPFLQPPGHSPCTRSLFHNHAKFTSGLCSLAIINHTLSVPPCLHCTCTFPASRLLSGLGGFRTMCQSGVLCRRTHLTLLVCL